LRIVADVVEQSSAADLADVIDGRACLVISRPRDLPSSREAPRPRDVDKRRQPNGRDFGEIIAQLRGLGSREAGFELLTSLHLTRREAEAIARSMDLPVVREDDTEQLRRKIIEETIGARLNSQAIRGQ
jgi:hypothetical protein